MPSIPITNVPPYIQYTAIGGQTDFTIPFVFFWDSVSYPNPLLVFDTPEGQEPNDVADLIAINTAYTITQTVNFTGSIILVTPANAGDIITIVRNMNNVRLNYYINGGAFTANAVNTDFESEVLYIQQNTYARSNITPHYNYTAAAVVPNDVILPVLQANQIWVKDPTNTFITVTTNVAPPPPPPGFVEWIVISGGLTMEEGFGYICQSGSGGGFTVTVPAPLVVGDMFAIAVVDTAPVRIQLQTGQVITVGNALTSSGGSLTTSARGDTVLLVATSTTNLIVLSGVTADYVYL